MNLRSLVGCSAGLGDVKRSPIASRILVPDTPSLAYLCCRPGDKSLLPITKFAKDSYDKAIQRSAMSTVTVETNLGKISLKLLPELAPETVRNFEKLAKDGFYDGTLFHRVIPGFMIQGGDPNTKTGNKSSWGTGGPGYTIKAEFNSRSHLRGIVSMARAQDPDSAGSQFFIVTTDSPFLDRQYTVFGEVVEGMDVADKIVNLQRDDNDCPLEEAKMLRVTVE